MSDLMPAAPGFLIRVLTVAALSSSVCCTALKTRPATVHVNAALQAAKEAPNTTIVGHNTEGAKRTHYRASLGTVLTALNQYAPPRTWTGTQSIEGWTVTFSSDSSGWHSIPPSWCEQITAVNPAKSLPRLERRVSTDGDGLPVVMVQKSTAEKKDPHVPKHGRRLAATMTADFAAGRKVTLTFHNTRNVDSAPVRGVARPLASDLSFPISEAMSRRYLSRFAFAGLIRPDNHLKDAGIYTPELFDPKKIPLVLIHGLESAPHIWANVMNEISADPELRRRYQVWYYLYPSGLTVHNAAAGLRKSLIEAREFYDPQHRSPAMQQMILAGHSMGGLLTRMQVIDSGEDIYRAFWTRPVTELPLKAETREIVSRSLYFKHLPFVARAIFISVPHRGSDVADLSIVRQLSRLIRPTKFITGILREMTSVARYAVNPDLHRFRDLGSRATEGLSPAHPLLHALERRPILVPFHNIIAVFDPFKRARPLEKSSDGVVAWNSAFLPGAESTTTVSWFHTCVECPAVAKEMVRILRSIETRP